MKQESKSVKKDIITVWRKVRSLGKNWKGMRAYWNNVSQKQVQIWLSRNWCKGSLRNVRIYEYKL